jgi:DNA replication and repair protein RecF
MANIEHLNLANFRLFKHFSLEPSPNINLISGINASGKTSILESIWYLATGTSFCTKNLDDLFHRTSDSGSIFSENPIHLLNIQAKISQENDSLATPTTYSIQRKDGKNQFFIADKIQKNAIKHAEKLATVLVTPENLLMIGGAPSLRRKRLNWGCFYIFPLYHKILSRYERALKQRNKALKRQYANQEIQQWDSILAREARYISECRESYLELLEPHFKHALECTVHSLDSKAISMKYDNTINTSPATELSEQFWLHSYEKSLQRDRRDGYTNYGPHRGDMHIKLQDRMVDNWLSRGQWKILSSVLLLSQAMLLKQKSNLQPIVLIDDFSSELDAKHQDNFIRYIHDHIGGQTFISAVSTDRLKKEIKHYNIKCFELMDR